MLTVIATEGINLVQDAGRAGFQHVGVPRSGFADPTLADAANTLVGNDAAAACIEFLFAGLTFTVDAATTFAVAADASVTVDGAPVPSWHAITVTAGSTVRVGALREGVRGYVAFAGGVLTELTLGSRSRCTLSGLGPAPLAPGATVCVGAARQLVRAMRPLPVPTTTMRVVPGPHVGLFPAGTWDRFVSQDWSVSPDSSRVGVRLTGAPLDAEGVHVPSLGMVRGAVQVPPDGLPIVLGPDHGVTGGYPVLAVVTAESQRVLAQRSPGQTVRFCSGDAATVPASRVFDFAGML